MQDIKLEETIYLAQRMKFYIESFGELDLYDLKEDVEALNLAYMFIEQLESLNTQMMDLLK